MEKLYIIFNHFSFFYTFMILTLLAGKLQPDHQQFHVCAGRNALLDVGSF